MKLIEIADPKDSKETVDHILHKYVFMRRLCTKWVSREMTIDQIQQRIHDSKECLEQFKYNTSKFLRLPSFHTGVQWTVSRANCR